MTAGGNGLFKVFCCYVACQWDIQHDEGSLSSSRDLSFAFGGRRQQVDSRQTPPDFGIFQISNPEVNRTNSKRKTPTTSINDERFSID
jgi:hypothetical protein